MTVPRIAVAGGFAALTLLSACDILSGAGPSTDALQNMPDVDIVNVTPTQSAAMADGVQTANDAAVRRALVSLQTVVQAPQFAFGPGTKVSVTLWSFSPRPGLASGPSSTPLGAFTVDGDGVILLPYVGTARLTGQSLQQAQDLLARRYASLGMFQSPSVSLALISVPQGQILVTGAIGQPKAISWRPGGMTLAEALTTSLGDGASLLAQNGDAQGHFEAISVTVLRTGAVPAQLPISVALEQNVPLQPGDRVVVRKAPAVEVSILGAGIQNSGVFDFAHVPTLSEVLARGAGLNANTADDHAVFVLREHGGTRPVLYNFSWNKAQGLIASHEFPMESGDLVYVAEAPIVPIQRVINLLFQAALPAQFIK